MTFPQAKGVSLEREEMASNPSSCSSCFYLQTGGEETWQRKAAISSRSSTTTALRGPKKEKKKKKGIHALKCPYQSLRSCKGFRSSPRSLALPPGWSPQCHHGWYREMPLPLPGHRQPRHSSREMRRVPRRFYPYLLFSFIFTFF